MKGILIVGLLCCLWLCGRIECLDEERAPCDMPDVFSGNFHSLKMDDNYCFTKMNLGHLDFDYNHQRMRVDYTKLIFNKKKFNMDVAMGKEKMYNGTLWYDFVNGIGYHYRRSNCSCSTFKISTDMMVPNIPDSAEFVGSAMIGGQSIETWHITAEDLLHNKRGGEGDRNPINIDKPRDNNNCNHYGNNKKNWGCWMSFSQESCLPLSMMVYNMDTERIKYTMNLYDVVPSVNPFVFEIPEMCKNAEKDPTMEIGRKDMRPLGPEIAIDV